MSTSTSLTHNEALPLNIGSYTLYCDNVKVTMAKNIIDECSVTGSPLLGGVGYKGLRVTFTCKIYNDENPYSFLVYLCTRARSYMNYDITYNGIIFKTCYFQHYDFEDSGKNYATVRITFLSQESIAEESP